MTSSDDDHTAAAADAAAQKAQSKTEPTKKAQPKKEPVKKAPAKNTTATKARAAAAKNSSGRTAAAPRAAAKGSARTTAAKTVAERAAAAKTSERAATAKRNAAKTTAAVAAAKAAAAKNAAAAQEAERAAAEQDAAAEAAEVVVAEPADQAEPAEQSTSPTESAPTESAPASGDEAAIRIRGLVKMFGDHTAVNGIDLTVPAGSFYGIVGPNGAGKTTTLSIIAGLLRSDAGQIVIGGIDQSTQPFAAKRILGVLPDRLRTFDRLTGRQLLYYYGLLRGLASSVIEKRVADLGRAFDLGDSLGRVVSDYSAGMTKKIMLAGAMIHSPRVLVLDEPFEAVDPVSSAVILDILRAYVAHGGTVILSSHGMDLVERVCSRIAIIVGGEVLAEGTIDEVRAGQTLESRFVELAGSSAEVEGLEWLHPFSD
ncbi:MAG: ATP-binding cassette domain-containing protein [Microbacterium sp.]